MGDRKVAFRSKLPSSQRTSDYIRLVRAPAALSVPGDVLAGAAAARTPWHPRVLGATASSVCMYWAGMALNDYADAAVDAVERPDRPVPSGRVPRRTALAVATGLTAASLGLAAATGGRRGLLGALPLTALVWSYDLGLKSTPAGPAVMAGARAADVLTGALAVAPPGTGATALRRGTLPAALIAAHTYTLTALSRHEIAGAPAGVPARTFAASTAAAVATAAGPVVRGLGGFGKADGPAGGTGLRAGAGGATPGGVSVGGASALASGTAAAARVTARAGALLGRRPQDPRTAATALIAGAAALSYLGSYGLAQIKAVRAPSGENVRGAVGAGITALVPLQAALTARAGAPVAAALLGAAHPLARRLARRVSPT
ncbi:SCO3242 family prenyltransferase [Streptomyces acidiscabies]|uniref:SCO3242 family prenyltransferase n=1 Tax=Streptomyces acidiscabies TaxID=42234 RepID=UPI00073F6C51|nr:UbiA family prenyltransferase [Streptomyces acidiscabies]GAQ50713.1 prenyltransferase [Streptomyces acidiscabies]